MNEKSKMVEKKGETIFYDTRLKVFQFFQQYSSSAFQTSFIQRFNSPPESYLSIFGQNIHLMTEIIFK